MKHTFHPHHKVKNNGPIDTLALLVGLFQPIVTIPQIYLVYTTQDASDVSLIMWAGFDIASVILLMYGIRHKLKPIIIAQTLWLVFQTPMVIAYFLFS